MAMLNNQMVPIFFRADTMSPWDVCRRSNKCYGSMAGSCADRTISPLDSRTLLREDGKDWKGRFIENLWKSRFIIGLSHSSIFITVSQHVPPRLTKWSWKVHTIGPIGCLLTCWINQLTDSELRHHLVPIYPHYHHFIGFLAKPTNSLFKHFKPPFLVA